MKSGSNFLKKTAKTTASLKQSAKRSIDKIQSVSKNVSKNMAKKVEDLKKRTINQDMPKRKTWAERLGETGVKSVSAESEKEQEKISEPELEIVEEIKAVQIEIPEDTPTKIIQDEVLKSESIQELESFESVETVEQIDSIESIESREAFDINKYLEPIKKIGNNIRDSIYGIFKRSNSADDILSTIQLHLDDENSQDDYVKESTSINTELKNLIHKKAPKLPIYADYASLTPIDPRVKKVMFEAMEQYSANPSSIYKRGVQAKKALEDARNSVASFFNTNKNEIIFTSGGTESNNFVFRGVIKAYQQDESIKKKGKPHVIVSTIEHPSIIEIALELLNEEIDVSFIPVNSEGMIDPKDIRKALKPETVLISVLYANNEIGTVQPIKEIAREVRHFKKSLNRDNSDYPYIHSDACQAALYEDMRILSLNIDLMTIDGGKVYGPTGTGVLVKRRHVKISPLLLGGSQENGLRAGTENLPAIIGLKHALDLAHSEKEEISAKLLEFRKTLFELISNKLKKNFPSLMINGGLANRLPNNLNICFPGIDAEFLVLRLDVLGVELSSVTSCRASNEDSSSYVIEALGRSDCSESSIRITLGRFTTAEEVEYIAEKVAEAVGEQIKANN